MGCAGENGEGFKDEAWVLPLVNSLPTGDGQATWQVYKTAGFLHWHGGECMCMYVET